MKPGHFPTKLLVLFFLSLSVPLQAAAEDATAEIQTVFKEYKNAVVSGDGERAASFIATRTLDYYQQMKQLALDGQPKQVKELNLMDRLMVLSLRHRISISQLEAMSAKGLFSYAVNQGWIGKEAVQEVSIGEIKVNGNTAKARQIHEGDGMPLNFIFHKEDSGWKLDMLPVLQTANAAIETSLREAGEDENKFILEALTIVSGTRPSNSIWEPLRK